MNQSVSIGERLREERQRLGLSQPAFGEIGGVTKKTQVLYESGERQPDALYLAAIQAIGVDVLFVLTGQRGSTPATVLTAEERQLLTRYAAADDDGRRMAHRVLSTKPDQDALVKKTARRGPKAA